MQLVKQAYQPKPCYRLPRSSNAGLATANHANSTSPSSATLANATAGYATLGGRYQFASIGGAATDYALFAYQVPSTHRLVIDGVNITAINTGATVATTATILDWGLGLNATAIDLGTADSGGTVFGPRRLPLGVQGFRVGDLIGYTAAPIQVYFTNPLVIEPSRYLHTILQVPVGTATGSEVFRGDVTFTGYFEAADDMSLGL